MRGYKGSWLDASWMREPIEKLHTADPAHARPDPGDPTAGGWAGAPIHATDPAPYIADPDGVGDWVVQTDGMIMDYTPVDHDNGYAGGNYRDGFTGPYDVNPGDLEYQRASAAAHTDDYGASRRLNYDVPPFQAHDERYESVRFEGVPAFELPAIVGGGQRGLNGSAVNNPPLEMYGGQGFRRGWVEQSWVDRKMYDPTRTHDERMVLANTAAYERNAPAVQDAGPYNSPFDSLARIITDVRQRPTMRRQPPPIVESITDDGSDATDAYEPLDWVLV